MRDVSYVYRVAVKHSCQRNEEYAARYICLTTKVVIFLHIRLFGSHYLS